MDHSFLSAFILLLLVLDPLGSLPVFIPIMRGVPPERRTWVAVREVGIAFGVLFAFMFLDRPVERRRAFAVSRSTASVRTVPDRHGVRRALRDVKFGACGSISVELEPQAARHPFRLRGAPRKPGCNSPLERT